MDVSWAKRVGRGRQYGARSASPGGGHPTPLASKASIGKHGWRTRGGESSIGRGEGTPLSRVCGSKREEET